MNDGNIVQMTVFGSSTGSSQPFLNVFHYRVNTTASIPLGDLQDEVQAYFLSLTPNILRAALDVMGNSYRFNSVRMDLLDNPDEFLVADVSSLPTGVVAGETLPPYVGWAFELQRRTRVTRNGRKVFAGVPEAYQNNGVASPAAIADLNQLADAIQNGFNITVVGVGSFTFETVIVRKTGAFTYSAVNDVLDTVYKRISTQNSRKG